MLYSGLIELLGVIDFIAYKILTNNCICKLFSCGTYISQSHGTRMRMSLAGTPRLLKSTASSTARLPAELAPRDKAMAVKLKQRATSLRVVVWIRS